jgi:hypothetical protein
MNIAKLNAELAGNHRPPLTSEQIACLFDRDRLESAANMLVSLASQYGVRLPLPEGVTLEGAFTCLEAALDAAERHAREHDVVTVDEMATDASRSTGEGNEFYVTAFAGPDAAVALTSPDRWTAYWIRGAER